jgi:hypothetical protein
MTRYEEFKAVMTERGWSYDGLNEVWRDYDRQPIDREKVLAALPDATWDELVAWGEEMEESVMQEIVENANLFSIGGPHDLRLRKFERAEVSFDSGPFDGEVVPTGFEPDDEKGASPVEQFARWLCLLAADGEGGQTVVGHKQTHMAVDLREAIDRERQFGHEYLIESVDASDGKTMTISCTFVETFAGPRDES